MSRHFFLSPSGTPCIKPPWGELVAVHPDSGKISWRVPLGEIGAAQGSVNLGGPTTTNTGVVFIGASIDGYFRAFDTKDGRELWKAKLPTSARATPALYKTEKGRHMVVIAAGGHDVPGVKLDTKLVAFALAQQE